MTPERPLRVVSLVPSATETLRALGVDAGRVHAVLRAAGPADRRRAPRTRTSTEIVALGARPRRRERRGEPARGRRARSPPPGSRCTRCRPRAVADVGPAVAALAAAVDARTPSPFGEGEWDAWLERHDGPRRGTVATLVWRRPWMTMRGDTYGASVLARLGWASVAVPGPDRYPRGHVGRPRRARTRPGAAAERALPVLGPPRRRGDGGVTGSEIALVDGRDLFWWGARTPDALDRLGALPALSGRSPR